ncbi:hypothetical protein QTP88_016893 [Uroleucon formosanum]
MEEKKVFYEKLDEYYKLKSKKKKPFAKYAQLQMIAEIEMAKIKTKLVIKPITTADFNERAQIDLVNFQSVPDGKFKWILNYQDHATKFVILRPLESKRATEVANELLSILLTFGAPKILQSDNGREFVNSIINELKDLWPECVIVHGRPRHPQKWFSSECLKKSITQFLTTDQVDKNVEFSVREMIKKFSGGQGVLSCSCKAKNLCQSSRTVFSSILGSFVVEWLISTPSCHLSSSSVVIDF